MYKYTFRYILVLQLCANIVVPLLEFGEHMITDAIISGHKAILFNSRLMLLHTHTPHFFHYRNQCNVCEVPNECYIRFGLIFCFSKVAGSSALGDKLGAALKNQAPTEVS